VKLESPEVVDLLQVATEFGDLRAYQRLFEMLSLSLSLSLSLPVVVTRGRR
jgi:hypothetical protein